MLIACKWCPGRDLNPHSACAKKDFKSFASADFATRAGAFRAGRDGDSRVAPVCPHDNKCLKNEAEACRHTLLA